MYQHYKCTKFTDTAMKHIDRKGSYSVKVDALEKYYGSSDLIPLWVADMDFETPLCIKEALQSVLDKGVFGYNYIPDEYGMLISNGSLLYREL